MQPAAHPSRPAPPADAGSPASTARGRRRLSGRWMSLPAVVMIGVFLGGPILIMAYVSLLSPGSGLGVNWGSPLGTGSYQGFLFEQNFDDELEFTTDYLQIFLRSCLLSGATTVICLAISFPTALWMSMRSPRSREILMFLVTIPFWTNLLIRNYAWILILRTNGLADNIAISTGLSDQGLNLLYTDFAVLLGLSYTFLPFMALPIYASLEKFDWRLLDAAYDLGANRRRALTRVIIPLAKPGIIAGCVLVFVPSLGAFVIPELLGGGKKMMIGNLVGMQFGAARNWPFGAALGLILLTIVLLAMLAFLWRSNRRRLAEGAVA